MSTERPLQPSLSGLVQAEEDALFPNRPLEPRDLSGILAVLRGYYVFAVLVGRALDR